MRKLAPFTAPLVSVIGLVFWYLAGQDDAATSWLWTATTCASLALLLWWICWPGHAHKLFAHLGLCLAILALGVVKQTGLWPCEISCKGAGSYAQLAGADVVSWTILVFGLLAALNLCRLHWKHPVIPTTLAVCSWLAAGSSLYFLWLSAQIGLLCQHCLATHSLILALPATTWGLTGWRRWSRSGIALAMLAIGYLGLHFAYHPDTRNLPSKESIPTVQLGGGVRDRHALLLADRGRQMGHLAAPVRMELIVDLQCSHCKTLVPKILHAVRSAITSNRLHVTVRFRYSPYDAGSRQLARYGMAAAAGKQLENYLEAMLGTKPGISEAEVSGRLPPTLSHLTADAAAMFGGIERLLAYDRWRLDQIGATRGRSPMVWIRDAKAQTTLQQGHIDLTQLLTTINK